MRKNKKALNSNSGIYYKREISVFDFSMLQFNKEGSLMHGNEMFLIFLSQSLYQAFQKHYQFVTDNRKIPRRGELITMYFCCGIAGLTEQWLKDNSITLEQAQHTLDICMRDNLRKMRDILIGNP